MRKLLVALTAVSWMGVVSAAQAQDFPSKAVRILVPYAAGTGPDVFTRMLGERLEKKWAHPVIVESRPGASGFIAIDALKKAPSDGHTMLLASNGHTSINPALYKKLPYDPARDLLPLVLGYRVPFFVAVSASGPYQTLPDLLTAAKTEGKVSYGTPYVGSPAHLGTAELELLTGTKMLHVPFKDQNQAFVSIANGELTWMLTTYASAAPMIQAGRIKLLAIASKERLKSHPEIPTVEEAGGPSGLVVESWVALFAPSGTPAAAIQKINADVNEALRAPDIQQRMRAAGWEPSAGTAQQLAELIREETKKYAKLVRQTGAKIE